MELAPASTPVDQARVGSSQLGLAATALSPMTGLSLPMTERATVAPSQASVVTSASNAFEEVADGFNFGPEFFGMESWSALSHGWAADIGPFPGGGIS